MTNWRPLLTEAKLATIRTQAKADDYDENSGVPGWYPQTVLALVDEVEKLRARVQELETERSNLWRQ